MDWDEPTVNKKPLPKDLTPMGVAELEAYIAGLHEEIARATAEVAKRGNTKSAAEAFFKKG